MIAIGNVPEVVVIKPSLNASSLSLTSLRATPKRFNGSVSPERPERKATNASSIGTLLKEAISAASSTSLVDISCACLEPRPNALKRFP